MMKTTKTFSHLIAISLTAILMLTGCLENPYSQPVHEISKILGANPSNIVLDFPSGSLYMAGPYCIFFTLDQKLARADLDRVTQSLAYTVTVEEFPGNTYAGSGSICDVEAIIKDGDRSKVKFTSLTLLRGDHLVVSDTPRTSWRINNLHFTETSRINIAIEQIEYTPSTAVIQLNGKPITKTLIIVTAP